MGRQMNFDRWRIGHASGRRAMKLRVEYTLDAQDVMAVLIWTYSKDCAADELPTLSKLRVECVLRDFYRDRGPSAIDACVYDDVADDELALFDQWAAETVSRCWPALADDRDVVAARRRAAKSASASVLDAPAVAYDPEDPHAPKAGV